MPERKFNRYSLAEYTEYLKSYANKVKFSEVHVHHTWKPTIADYRKQNDKHSIIQAMWRYHTETRGWADIAQHITIDPDGFIWDGRSLLSAPASSTGYNDSDDDGVHPFMFEMIGNFDIGQERLEGAQLDTVLGVVALLLDVCQLKEQHIRFHREMQSGKSCPGTGIDKQWFLHSVRETRKGTLKEEHDNKGTAITTIKASELPTIQEVIQIQVNGKSSLQGYLINGTTYAPLRSIMDQLQVNLEWDPTTKTASIHRGGA